MNEAKNMELAELAPALLTGKLNIVDYLADDVVFNLSGFARFQGKQEVLEDCFEPIVNLLSDSGETVVDNVIAQGDTVVVQTRGVGRSTAKGEPYENSYCIIMQFKDGKLQTLNEYFDTALARKVLPELPWSPVGS